jgi:hypothetical protein
MWAVEPYPRLWQQIGATVVAVLMAWRAVHLTGGHRAQQRRPTEQGEVAQRFMN